MGSHLCAECTIGDIVCLRIQGPAPGQKILKAQHVCKKHWSLNVRAKRQSIDVTFALEQTQGALCGQDPGQ